MSLSRQKEYKTAVPGQLSLAYQDGEEAPFKPSSRPRITTSWIRKPRRNNTGKDWPWLGLSEVQVVNAIEVHVLCVPGEGGLPHAKVEIGSVDTLNDNTTLLLYHVQQRVEVTNVPLVNVLRRRKYFQRVTINSQQVGVTGVSHCSTDTFSGFIS